MGAKGLKQEERIMKKFSWILALVVALSMVLVGCNGDPSPTPPPEQISKLGLEVIGTDAWNGFDLVHATHPAGEHDSPLLAFQAGDTIEIEGRVIRGGNVGINLNQGGERWLSSWKSSGSTFASGVLTLTQEDVDAMTTSEHAKAARVRGDAANTTFVVEKLVIMRGATVLFDLVEDILENLDIGETDRNVIFGEGPDRDFPIHSAGPANSVSFRVVGPGAATAPTITTQPAASTLVELDETNIPSLTVVASAPGAGETQSFQWQVLDDATWTNITDATSATLALAAHIGNAEEVGNWQFRVIVTNKLGEATASATSSVAAVSVFDPDVTAPVISITAFPEANKVHSYGNERNIGGNQWEIGDDAGNYNGRLGFAVGATVTSVQYVSVTITFVTDKDARFSFFTGPTNSDRFGTGGDFQGWYDLRIDAGSRTITLPADVAITHFAFENKEDGEVTITITSVVFNPKT